MGRKTQSSPRGAPCRRLPAGLGPAVVIREADKQHQHHSSFSTRPHSRPSHSHAVQDKNPKALLSCSASPAATFAQQHTLPGASQPATDVPGGQGGGTALPELIGHLRFVYSSLPDRKGEKYCQKVGQRERKLPTVSWTIQGWRCWCFPAGKPERDQGIKPPPSPAHSALPLIPSGICRDAMGGLNISKEVQIDLEEREGLIGPSRHTQQC